MKIISDFDDVLFNNKKLKEIIFFQLAHIGVSPATAEEEYKKNRADKKPFSLKTFLFQFAQSEVVAGELYESIMGHCKDLVQTETLELILGVGVENVYILTNGDEEFQRDKIRRSLGEVFPNMHIVEKGKGKEVERICKMFPSEDVIFVDDKREYFNDINMKECPNLKNVLFSEFGLQTLSDEMDASREDELKRSAIGEMKIR